MKRSNSKMKYRSAAQLSNKIIIIICLNLLCYFNFIFQGGQSSFQIAHGKKEKITDGKCFPAKWFYAMKEASSHCCSL